MLQGEHSAICLSFIKLPIVIKIFILSILEWPFYTGFTVYENLHFYPFRYDDQYTLKMNFTDGASKKSRSGEITKSVAEFFDDNGVLCFDLFEPEVCMLQSRIVTSKKE